MLRQDVPSASGLESLVRAAQPGSVGELPSLQTEYFEFLDTKTSLLLLIGIGGLIGFVGMAWAVGFLGVAARGREAPMRKVILYVPIVGGVVRRRQRADGPDRHAHADERLSRRPADRRGRGDAPRTTSWCGRTRCSSSGR